MAQGPQDTLCNWGTADANAIAWRDTMIRMVNAILQEHGRAADIANAYGYQSTDWGARAKVRTADKKSFIG
jgi:hypothetical protein